jgi:hypothetical protein
MLNAELKSQKQALFRNKKAHLLCSLKRFMYKIEIKKRNIYSPIDYRNVNNDKKEKKS